MSLEQMLERISKEILKKLSLPLSSFVQKLLHQVQNDTITHAVRIVVMSNVVGADIVRINLF